VSVAALLQEFAMGNYFEKEADSIREDKRSAEATRIARHANKIAIITAISAVIMAIIAIISMWLAWRSH
jgi:hypothetical protein